MRPTLRLRIISRKKALTTRGNKLPAVCPPAQSPAPPTTKKWKRSRGKGNLVPITWSDPPKGVWKSDGNGRVPAYYWCPERTADGKKALVQGYDSHRVRLHGSLVQMRDMAEQLQQAVELYLTNNIAVDGSVRYTGTLSSLIRLYRSSEESGYFALKYNTAANYDGFLNMIDRTHGRRRISAITRKDLFQMHKGFLKPASGNTANAKECVSKANRAMQIVRILIAFGIGIDDHCERLRSILSTMRFESESHERKQYLTIEHVVSFIAKANELGFSKMALAQAFQFETALRQKDCIGEYWPEGARPNTRNRLRAAQGLPPVMTEVWTSGLVWGTHISPDLILAKPTSKSRFKKLAISDLNLCPLVMAELSKIPIEDRNGPVITDEKTGEPYKTATYRARWRNIANLCGIPEDHCNMDSRAGAISEGGDAGIEEELLQRFATHSDKEMTRHYNRQTLTKVRIIHRARNAHRAAPDESKFDNGPIIDAE